jgi:hypothetical protein
VQVKSGGECGERADGAVIGVQDDVADLEAASVGGTIGSYVIDDDAPVLRETQSAGETLGDGLRASFDFDAMHVSVLAQTLIDETDDARGNGKAEAFASAGGRENESVDADDIAFAIDERAAAVAGIDGSIGLNVDERTVGVGLPRDGTDHAHGNGVLQALGTAHGEDQFALMHGPVRAERKCGQVRGVDF